MPHRKLKSYRHWSEDTKSTIATFVAMALVVGFFAFIGYLTR